jgi:hypothetical protein
LKNVKILGSGKREFGDLTKKMRPMKTVFAKTKKARRGRVLFCGVVFEVHPG